MTGTTSCRILYSRCHAMLQEGEVREMPVLVPDRLYSYLACIVAWAKSCRRHHGGVLRGQGPWTCESVVAGRCMSGHLKRSRDSQYSRDREKQRAEQRFSSCTEAEETRKIC